MYFKLRFFEFLMVFSRGYFYPSHLAQVLNLALQDVERRYSSQIRARLESGFYKKEGKLSQIRLIAVLYTSLRSRFPAATIDTTTSSSRTS